MKHRFFLLLLSLLTVTQLMAGPRWRSFINWVDSADVAGADTLYVGWTKQDFIASLRFSTISSTLSLQYVNESNPADRYKGFASTDLQTPISIGLAYRGWGLSYSHSFSNTVDDELSFSTCGQRYGAELRYQHNHSFTGTIENEVNSQANIEIRPGDITQKLYYANFYYVFNHKRFSLPAARLQTVIQRRSAGSWLAAVNFQRCLMDFSHKPFLDASFTTLSFGGGYAYNFAFAHEHCLLHTSVMPFVDVYKHLNVSYDEDRSDSFTSFSINGNLHLSFIYNASRYLLGLANDYYLTQQSLSDNLAVVDLNWSTRVFIGVRF